MTAVRSRIVYDSGEPPTELLSNVVFSGTELGGLLHDSVGEFDSLNEWDDLLVAA